MSLSLGLSLVIGAAVTASAMGAFSRTKRELKGIEGSIDRLNTRKNVLQRLNATQALGGGGGSQAGVRMGIRSLSRLNNELDTLGQKRVKIEAATQAFSSMGKSIGFVVSNAAPLAAALVGLGKPIRDAANFEKEMMGVAKQMEGARDKSGRLTESFFEMRKQILKMGREIPMAHEEIAKMATAGLRMNVPKDKVLGFVNLASQMSIAFEAPAEQLAEQMGKVGKIYGIPVENMKDLADSINYLDDNAISKGSDIIEVLQRIGGTAAMLKMPAKDAAALGSTFLTLGDSAEVASTASNALMRELSLATSQPAKFQRALNKLRGLDKRGKPKIPGLSAKEIQDGMAKDAKGTILKVLDAINGIKDEGLRMSITTDLFGKEYGDNVAKLAVGVDEFRRQIGLANDEAARNSMQREFDAQKESFSAQWTLMTNQMKELSITMGNHLLPTATAVIKVFRGMGQWVTELANDFPSSVKNLSAALSGMLIAFPVLKIAGSISAIFTAMKGGATTMAFFKTSLLGLRAVIAGHPLLIMGTLLAGIGMLIYQNWDAVSIALDGVFAWVDQRLDSVKMAFSETPRLASVAVVGVTGSVSAAIMKMGASFIALGTKIGAGVGKGMSALKALGGFLKAHPLLIAVTVLAGAAYLVYQNWEPIKAFFLDLWEKAKEGFNAFMGWLAPWVDAGVAQFNVLRDGIAVVVDWVVGKVEAMIGTVQKGVGWAKEQVDSVTGVYDSARSGVSDAIESTINFFSGKERVRADAPVEPRRQPPPLPLAASARTVTNNQNNTVTIQVTQRPGENMTELARRIREEQERAVQTKARGSLFDTPAMAY